VSKSKNNSSVVRQVELIIRQIECLSTLPEIATAFLTSTLKGRCELDDLSQIIESDPAITAKIFSLAYDAQVDFTDGKPSIGEAIAKLPVETIGGCILSIKVFQSSEADNEPLSKSVLPRRQLALHSLATACCAKKIADIVLDECDRGIAFSAGLLHDIGKLALADVMPKSFAKIAAEAKKRGTSLRVIEHEHLGVDHTVIGKRLGEKWHFPDQIVLGIWLHHSDTEVITDNIENAKIAQVVRLADIIARRCGIGMSGSFDDPGSVGEVSASLGISSDAIADIEAGLADEVAARSRLLGFSCVGDAGGSYCQLVGETAAQLSARNSELNAENRRLSINSAFMELVNEFVLSVTPSMLPCDVALSFARCWQKHFQTGPVAVYLCEDRAESFFEVASVDETGAPGVALLKFGDDASAIWRADVGGFDVYDAGDRFQWLFDQLEVKFDVARTKFMPLPAHGKSCGGVIFEHRLPVDIGAQRANLEVCLAIAGRILALSFAAQKQGSLSEKFAQALSQLKDMRHKVADANLLASVAEMAAGAAHELNNPLAVISGRVQLLYEVEGDASKKNMLKQIQDRSDEISRTVNDLMKFSRPKKPDPLRVSVLVLVDGAVETVRRDKGMQIDVDMDQIDDLQDVMVDPGQLVTAIANIVSNSVDSYSGGGVVVISGACVQSEGAITFQICDTGCGMDSDTLSKAVQPFFSAKAAGRKRGMGLAHSQRLLLLNKCTMQITSTPEKGTCVTITLPQA
jgi:putative nucleotidyltransferase with HDIG domain